MNTLRRFPFLALLCVVVAGCLVPGAGAEEGAGLEAVAEFDAALVEARQGTSEARQRLAVRRVIRDAEEWVAARQGDSSRFPGLEFLFRARQQLIALDNDPKYRAALLDTARELVGAPDSMAELRLEADLLLSQAELAKSGANAEQRAEALRPFVERYVETSAGSRVLRVAMAMALELGDVRLVNDLREMIAERFAGDLDMITFQRDKLGGQVFGAPFAGTFERSDGKTVRFPMDGLGRSTLCVFWSTENGGEEVVRGLAAAALEKPETLEGRLEVVSFNLDDLPDAGESIIRGLGVDWQVLRLPGGIKHPVYQAYVRIDPRILTVSPTGQAAMIMAGSTRKKVNSDGTPDYTRMFQSVLARTWTDSEYSQQLSALMTGEFLILDPEGGIDPARPPEWQASGREAGDSLSRGADAVPNERLQTLQSCFVHPPERYRLSHAKVRANYEQAVKQSREIIAAHPQASDLWVVRNRLIISLMGLWKTDADLGRFESAVVEAEQAVAAGYPLGCDVVARFCLARAQLRDPAADPAQIIDQYVVDGGGEDASGPVLATASLLALDVADRWRFSVNRERILKAHTEDPMMWIYSSFLLDRHHDYWLFQVPFTAGWSYGRRESYFLTLGDVEEAHRILRTELQTAEGKPFRIPEDLKASWTAIFFAQPEPWSAKRDDGLPPSPYRTVQPFAEFAASRPHADVDVALAVLGEEALPVLKDRRGQELDCKMLTVPKETRQRLMLRLGMLSEDRSINSVLLGKDGRIVVAVSGLARQSSRSGNTLINVVAHQDEQTVVSALERGDLEAAKKHILALAPPFDPEAVDDRGRKLRKPTYNIAHLRARARVYQALGDLQSALADAEEVVERQTATDGGMSLRTEALNKAEALRDSIQTAMGVEKPAES